MNVWLINKTPQSRDVFQSSCSRLIDSRGSEGGRCTLRVSHTRPGWRQQQLTCAAAHLRSSPETTYEVMRAQQKI